MERLHAVVEGVVQGVGFRQFTLYQAQRLDLHGWVKNRWDRKVEVIAEGPREKLDTLVLALNRGPAASEVRNVHLNWGQATGEFTEFTIRH